MSRLRDSPEKLFEVFFEVGKPSSENEEPFILQKYPLDYNDEEVLKSVPKFAFPCDTERYTVTVDHFTFTLTDLDSKFKFGFCRHATGAQTCFCIISFLPWFEVFYNLLNILAEITNRSEDNDVVGMLRCAYVQEVPSWGLPVTIVAGQEMFSFKAPESNKLPSIPASRNLTEYYNAVDVENMMVVFASMLNERRIIVTSKKLSRLTAVIHAASSLLYPMFWQHLFIPVLPAFLIDYLSAPMPFVIGVHHKLMEKAMSMDLGDAVIIDADKNEVRTEYEDLENLPDEMSSYLKRHLKGEKFRNAMQESGDSISRTFMLSLVKLIGGYRDALKFTEGETISFNPEAFVQSRPLSMQPFLENMLHLQIFQQFINDRLDMLNCGRGFADIFEQECLVHADKLNSQSRYNEWLGKMKKQGKKFHKGGRDVWSDFKVKAKPMMKEASLFMDSVSQRARPMMKEARGVVDTVSHRVYKQAGPAMTSAVESVKTQGKKVASKAKSKMNEFKKEDDGSPKTPKSAKSVRLGPKTKSFSKDKPIGIIKDRPSTIVGSPLKTMRPPRPGPTSPGSSHHPHVHVDKLDRKSHFTSHIETDNRTSADDTDLLAFQRVSCNLLADPEIQHAMYKSASAEHLPKEKLQTMGSSDTLTSSSSAEGELDSSHCNSGRSRFKGDSSTAQYTNLLDDDDSGIVMRTNSQTSLDKARSEGGSRADRDMSVGAPTGLADQKMAPPPRPLPRKSTTPHTPVTMQDEHGSNPVRERPKPAPRRLSFEVKSGQTTSGTIPTSAGDSLIDLAGHSDRSVSQFSLADQFDKLDASGDYVTLKEEICIGFTDSTSKRASVIRTPAMKYGQNETPRKTSVRKDYSPYSSDDSQQTGSSSLLDFDPLSESGNRKNKSEMTPPQMNQSGISSTASNNQGQSDSLLHDWNIGHLSNITNTSQSSGNQSNFMYGHPTPPPRKPVQTMTSKPMFYTPQPPSMANRSSAQSTYNPTSSMGFHNPMSQMVGSKPSMAGSSSSQQGNTPVPQVPPRPKSRTNPHGNVTSQTVNLSNDPFEGLVDLNNSNPPPRPSTGWETFQ